MRWEKEKKAPEGDGRGPVAGKLSKVPKRPGVYVFKGAREKVLYVGKGKDLRARLGSYFRKSAALDERKAAMVRAVRDFSYIVTESELEALALEANLIKQYKPRYNVVLRDDKSYPYLRLTVNEKWPCLEVVRRIAKDGAMYFGPYVPAGNMWEALGFIRRNFGIRPCKKSLERPMRPCVEHQIGRCPAPCAGLIGEDEYAHNVREVELFLRGRNREIIRGLEEKMRHASDEMRYEEAAILRDRIVAFNKAFESQRVVAPGLGDLDVMGFYREGEDAAFQVFFIKNGVMVGAKDYYLRELGGIPDDELMHGFIETFYARDLAVPPELAVLAMPSGSGNLQEWLGLRRGGRVRIHVPKRGKKAELIGMAGENARLMAESRRGEGHKEALAELGVRLSLKRIPQSIGALDISSISGADAVGAYVHWAGGEFQKDLYRRVKIRTVAMPDDYAMMREALKRVLKEEGVVPDLLVIDGGRGHLEAGLRALDELYLRMGGQHPQRPMAVSVAKSPDRVFRPGAEEPLAIDDRSASSLLMRRVRDEAHRFAISLHRKLRARRLMHSPLENVRGIARKRRLALLKRFGSLDAIRAASVEELAGVEGMNRRAAEDLKAALEGEKSGG